ncbi:MAG TPA: polyprenyl synthetase family protein [Acidimicrobiales bacterium]
MDGARLARELGVADLEVRLGDVDRRLLEVVDGVEGLSAPSRRVTAAGGKRLRPAFTIATAALGGVDDRRVVDAAAAVELVQIGSLVHDDLLDGAATRRGVPTINGVEGAPIALLAGDFLLARAGELAAGVGPETAALLATTIAELCVGQSQELQQTADLDRTIDQHLASIRGKTARLFGCACEIGALVAGLPATVTQRLARYGESFGMAFQLLDDILDLASDPERLGKPIGTDLATGVYTLPVLLAAQDLRSAAALSAHLRAGEVAAATDLVLGSGAVDAALGRVDAFVEAATAAATAAAADAAGGGVPGAAGLGAFARSYVAWALEAFVDRRRWSPGERVG